MRFLLDENFPLGLQRVLLSDGWDADHIITLAWRGASDQRIRERLQDPQIVFFTQDDDFLFGETVAAVVVLSRVRQSRPLKERIEVWRKACRDLLRTAPVERFSSSLTRAYYYLGKTSHLNRHSPNRARAIVGSGVSRTLLHRRHFRVLVC